MGTALSSILGHAQVGEDEDVEADCTAGGPDLADLSSILEEEDRASSPHHTTTGQRLSTSSSRSRRASRSHSPGGSAPNSSARPSLRHQTSGVRTSSTASAALCPFTLGSAVGVKRSDSSKTGAGSFRRADSGGAPLALAPPSVRTRPAHAVSPAGGPDAGTAPRGPLPSRSTPTGVSGGGAAQQEGGAAGEGCNASLALLENIAEVVEVSADQPWAGGQGRPGGMADSPLVDSLDTSKRRQDGPSPHPGRTLAPSPPVPPPSVPSHHRGTPRPSELSQHSGLTAHESSGGLPSSEADRKRATPRRGASASVLVGAKSGQEGLHHSGSISLGPPRKTKSIIVGVGIVGVVMTSAVLRVTAHVCKHIPAGQSMWRS